MCSLLLICFSQAFVAFSFVSLRFSLVFRSLFSLGFSLFFSFLFVSLCFSLVFSCFICFSCLSLSVYIILRFLSHVSFCPALAVCFVFDILLFVCFFVNTRDVGSQLFWLNEFQIEIFNGFRR